MISDNRRIRIYRVVSVEGTLSLDQGSEVWQENGKVCGVGLWYDLLIPVPDDLVAQAKAKDISPLEWLKRKLESVTFLRVDVV